jgi:hypothetical protein
MNDFIERKRRSPSPTSALSAQDARARIRRAVAGAMTTASCQTVVSDPGVAEPWPNASHAFFAAVLNLRQVKHAVFLPVFPLRKRPANRGVGTLLVFHRSAKGNTV